MAFKRSSSTLGNVERKRRSDYGKKKRTWTKEELDYLSRYYGNESVSSISRALKRTKRAVRLKALQEGLRIVKPRKNSVNLKLTETVSKLNEPKGRISKSKTGVVKVKSNIKDIDTLKTLTFITFISSSLTFLGVVTLLLMKLI